MLRGGVGWGWGGAGRGEMGLVQGGGGVQGGGAGQSEQARQGRRVVQVCAGRGAVGWGIVGHLRHPAQNPPPE